MASTTINPKSGLSPKDIQILREQWKLIDKDHKVIVVDLFVEYFKNHSEGQALFKTLNGDPESLRNSPKMLAHATNVTYSISAMINNLDDPDVVIAMIDRIGNNHFRHQVSPKNVDDMKKTFECCLLKHLGSALTKDAEVAWNRFADLVFNSVAQHIDKLKSQA